MRPKSLQMSMSLTFEIFGRSRNHGKRLTKYCQASFSGVVSFQNQKSSDITFTTKGPVGLTRIASLKTKACDSTDQVVLGWSYTGRVQILHGSHRKEGCVQSFQLERKEQFLQK